MYIKDIPFLQVRELAIKYSSDTEDILDEELMSGFIWKTSPEGEKFWVVIYDFIMGYTVIKRKDLNMFII